MIREFIQLLPDPFPTEIQPVHEPIIDHYQPSDFGQMTIETPVYEVNPYFCSIRPLSYRNLTILLILTLTLLLILVIYFNCK